MPFVSSVLKAITAIGSLSYVAVVAVIGAVSLGGIVLGISQSRASYVLMGIGLSFMLVNHYYRWHPKSAKNWLHLRFRLILGAIGFVLLLLATFLEK